MKIASSKKSTIARRRGQGMTEYIIIVALIAIATIGIVGLFGDNIRRLFGMASDSIAGEASVAQANTSGASSDVDMTKKNMKTFGLHNSY